METTSKERPMASRARRLPTRRSDERIDELRESPIATWRELPPTKRQQRVLSMIEHERGIVFPDTLTREAAAAIIERRFKKRRRS